MRRLHFASRLTSCRPPIFHPRASRKYTSTLARTNTLAASHCILTSRQKSICFSKSYMCLFFFCVAHRHYFVKSGSRKAMLPHTTLPRRATRKSHTVTIYAWREWGMLMRHSGEPLRFISIFFFLVYSMSISPRYTFHLASRWKLQNPWERWGVCALMFIDCRVSLNGISGDLFAGGLSQSSCMFYIRCKHRRMMVVR